MPKRNIVSWSSVIAGFVRHGSAIQGFASEAYQIYAVVIRLGYEWNLFVKNALLTALIRNGQLNDANKAFDGWWDKDIVTWNAMISGYVQFSPSEIPGFWSKMIGEGVMPDAFTFSVVLTSLAGVGNDKFAMQMHGQLVKFGHGSETCVGNSVVNMYLKFGDLVNGLRAFHEIISKNVRSWTEMATGCLTCGVPSKALELLAEMQMVGKKAHGLRIKLGSEMDTCVDNALLDMYVKCGCIENAMTVFRRMKDRTTITWTTLIMGFAQNGLVLEALLIFNEMVTEGFEPNHITFVCVLYACCQGGFVDEGWKYFSSMTIQYGICPTEDHYVCMVDLLGRTGQIKEAEELITKMPFQPGPLIWQTLLGACHIHGDFKTGKHAAERAMQLKQSDSSTYVLLSNMLSGLNHWEGAKTMRNMMKSRSVNKTQGTSSFKSIDIPSS
ncbi:hypothetical protein RDABS01_035857 [Bienertia sinuspersici]